MTRSGARQFLCRQPPARTASTRAWWSRSFWSAYASAKVTSARSKASLRPRYAAIAIRSPDRACARARVMPHTSPNVCNCAGDIVSGMAMPFQSRNWRT